MAKRPRYRSPRLDLHIGDEQWKEAVAAASGGCLITDAIKKQYPHLTGVTTDMATIRASDTKQGVRYTYLTPASAQHLLLSFDQGWRQPIEEITIPEGREDHPDHAQPQGARGAEGPPGRSARPSSKRGSRPARS